MGGLICATSSMLSSGFKVYWMVKTGTLFCIVYVGVWGVCCGSVCEHYGMRLCS